MTTQDAQNLAEPTLPDLTSVRSLITSVTPLAKHLGITPNGVYRWIKVNRIPGSQVVKIANFYNVELHDLIPLTGSENANANPPKIKSRNVLPALLEVYTGKRDLKEACESVGIPEISGKLTMLHWGDQLPTLYTTLEQLDQKRISLVMAQQRLKVTGNTLFGIRRKYGYAPGRPVGKPKPPTLQERKDSRKEVLYELVAGRHNVIEAATLLNVSTTTMFRILPEVCPYKTRELLAWPASFRKAYVDELRGVSPEKYVEKWLKIGLDNKILLRNVPKYPKTPETWRNADVTRMLIGWLLGEATIEEIAASRGTEPVHLQTLFTSQLQVWGVSYNQASSLGINHQIALGEALLAMYSRKRRGGNLTEMEKKMREIAVAQALKEAGI